MLLKHLNPALSYWHSSLNRNRHEKYRRPITGCGIFREVVYCYANVITVPVLPSNASIAFAREVIIAFLSGFAFTNFIAA